tara:strand:+ start:751 stop:900 length:150 start_codon:yes stop_codon:yes gene_type:complete
MELNDWQTKTTFKKLSAFAVGIIPKVIILTNITSKEGSWNSQTTPSKVK